VVRLFGHEPVDGLDGIELDLRLSPGGRLVVTHDPVFDETTPLLVDVLDAARGFTVNIEVKNFPRDEQWDPEQRVIHDLLALLDERACDDVLVSCFDFGAIDLVRGRYPTAMLYLSRRPADVLLDAVVAHGHRIVHPYDTMVDDVFMAAARARDLEVNVWTLDVGLDRYRELLELDVDGIITDEAAVLATSGTVPGRPASGSAR